MPVRSAEAVWEGDLQDGKGTLRLGSGAFDGQYSFSSRFEEGTGTNPEELIGAAHAGCFSMALAAALAREGHTPTRVQTTARVKLEKVGDAMTITGSALECEGEVPGIDEATFLEFAENAKKNCIVSRALGAIEITLAARLVS
ncbi:MAG TPA: OsmC family protein [Actinomycetota bacterium]|jgi:osmotically inducible protein OsmC|nr:OsmC family protein [Actinomycetota bacterium]